MGGVSNVQPVMAQFNFNNANAASNMSNIGGMSQFGFGATSNFMNMSNMMPQQSSLSSLNVARYHGQNAGGMFGSSSDPYSYVAAPQQQQMQMQFVQPSYPMGGFGYAGNQPSLFGAPQQ